MKECMYEFYYVDNDNEICINIIDIFYFFIKLFLGK